MYFFVLTYYYCTSLHDVVVWVTNVCVIWMDLTGCGENVELDENGGIVKKNIYTIFVTGFFLSVGTYIFFCRSKQNRESGNKLCLKENLLFFFWQQQNKYLNYFYIFMEKMYIYLFID